MQGMRKGGEHDGDGGAETDAQGAGRPAGRRIPGNVQRQERLRHRKSVAWRLCRTQAFFHRFVAARRHLVGRYHDGASRFRRVRRRPRLDRLGAARRHHQFDHQFSQKTGGA